MTTQKRMWALGAGVLMVFLLLSASQSPSFRECAAGHKGTNQNAQITDEKPTPILTSGNMFVCTIEAIERNDKIIDLFATIVIAFFTGTLWASTRGLHQATTRLVVAADGQAADLKAAIEAINATATAGAEANVLAEKALHANDRAWVGMNGIVGEPPTDVQPFMMCGLSIKNTGRSPALKAQGWFFPVVRGRHDRLPDVPAKQPPGSPQNILLPNGSLVFNILGEMMIDQARYNRIVSGEEVLWVVGRIDYLDVNERPHWTTFRASWQPGNRWFTSSAEGNHAT